MKNQIAELAKKIAGDITRIRHDIHQHPETGYQETRTAGIIESFLDEHGIPHQRCAGTGVTALVGREGGRVVGLRSEMDALKTPDLTGLPYASRNEGVAHACGHDGHIAMLLGATWVLKQLEDELPGMVKFIWQPAEEGGAGGKKMIEDGVLEAPSPEAIFAVHGWPSLAVGAASYRFGTAMASVDNFEIVVKGTGAHAAMPHAGIDPIPISAGIIEGIQRIRSRMINPVTPCVISITTIHGGTVENIIPDEVTMTGTIRTIDPETRRTVPELMERTAVMIARASGGDTRFRLVGEGYPPTVNDRAATAFARDALIDLLGSENVVENKEPVMGGEDFAYYLEKIPGTFIHLGTGDRPPLHNSAYDFNDESIPYGIRIMAGIAEEFLRKGLPVTG